MQDSGADIQKRFVLAAACPSIQKVVNRVCQRYGQLVGHLIAQADGQVGLRVKIDKQYFAPLSCQTDTEIHASGRFSNAAFLIGDSYDFVFHNDPFQNSIQKAE